jgi:hypothetical protein
MDVQLPASAIARRSQFSRTLLNLLFTICLLLPYSAGGQPTNDFFHSATQLNGTFIEGKIAITNVTLEAGEPTPGSGMDQTVWYTWRAPESGTASFNVVGNSGRGVSGAVYFGRWPELRLIHYALRTASVSLKFPVAKNQTISFQIGRESGQYSTRAETAFWTISLQTVGSILDGLSVAGPATAESDSFGSPVDLSGEQSTGISYPLWAEHGPTNPNEAGYNNSWFRWTAPHPGSVILKCSSPWPWYQYGAQADKKRVGVFTGPDLPNLTAIATAKGINDVGVTFEAREGQTYYISVGKETTDASLGWVITTLTQKPVLVQPFQIERAVRLRVLTAVEKTYQVQVSADLKTWSDVGQPIEGTGQPEWVYSPTSDLRQRTYRILEISPISP